MRSPAVGRFVMAIRGTPQTMHTLLEIFGTGAGLPLLPAILRGGVAIGLLGFMLWLAATEPSITVSPLEDMLSIIILMLMAFALLGQAKLAPCAGAGMILAVVRRGWDRFRRR